MRNTALALATVAALQGPASMLPPPVGERNPVLPSSVAVQHRVQETHGAKWMHALIGRRPVPQMMPTAQAGLLSVDPVKNARALLRNSLPVNNKIIREIQVGIHGYG